MFTLGSLEADFLLVLTELFR